MMNEGMGRLPTYLPTYQSTEGGTFLASVWEGAARTDPELPGGKV